MFRRLACGWRALWHGSQAQEGTTCIVDQWYTVSPSLLALSFLNVRNPFNLVSCRVGRFVAGLGPGAGFVIKIHIFQKNCIQAVEEDCAIYKL